MTSLLTPFLWSFLPSQITHIILPTLSSFIPALLPPAPQSSPLYARNYRLVFTALVVLSLAYNLAWGSDDEVNSDKNQAEWYSLLGVGWRASDDQIKKSYRNLSRQHHPDRAGPEKGDSFILIRHAYEKLSDPIQRFAYDRFGPSIADSKAASAREHIIAGLQRSSGFYIVSGGIMGVLALLGKAREGAYWRYILFAFLFILEVNLLISSNTTPTTIFSPLPLPISIILRRLIPTSILDRPPFLLIRTLHRLWTSLSIGISQLASVWSDPPDDEVKRVMEAQLLALATSCQAESMGALSEDISAVIGRNGELEPILKREMEQVFLDRALAGHPRVSPYYRSATQRIANEFRQSSAGENVAHVATKIPLPPSPRLLPQEQFS